MHLQQCRLYTVSISGGGMEQKRYLLEHSFGHLVSTVARTFSVQLGKRFQQAGIDITTEQWHILMSLWNRDGQYQYELANCQDKDRASITRLIDNMEKRNLVVRIPSKTDRRTKLVYLTSKGRSLQDVLMQLVDQTIAVAVKGIDNEQVEQTKSVLKAIRKNLNIHEKNRGV